MKKLYLIMAIAFISNCKNNNSNFIAEQIMNPNSTDSLSKSNKGQIESEKKDEVNEGAYSELHKNGKIALSGTMSKGLKNGVWKKYNENGDILTVEEFYNDSLMFVLD